MLLIRSNDSVSVNIACSGMPSLVKYAFIASASVVSGFFSRRYDHFPVTVIVGAIPAWYCLYASSSRNRTKWGSRPLRETPPESTRIVCVFIVIAWIIRVDEGRYKNHEIIQTRPNYIRARYFLTSCSKNVLICSDFGIRSSETGIIDVSRRSVK